MITEKSLCITACKRHNLAPAHAGQHKATSPTRNPLALTLKDDTTDNKRTENDRNDANAS